MEGNITYSFALETPPLFPFSFVDKENPAWLSYKNLEIKTYQKDNKPFRDGDNKWGVIGRYWNLCIPDDNKGFSMTGYNDKLTLDDKG
jgi:hypothetical protein